jgi:hypothetical protein
MTRRTRHLTFLLITALAALGVTGAALAERPNDQGGPIGVGAVTASAPAYVASSPNDQGGMIGVGAAATTEAPDAFERAAAIHAARADAPDVIERAAIRAVADTAVRPDDRPGLRGPGQVPTGAVVATSSTEHGFQWGDASLGAGLGLVLGVLLVAGLVALTVRHRGGPVSA